MPRFSYPTIIFVLAVCVFVILMNVFKVRKGALILGVGLLVVWLCLHYTGYEETLYNIIFNAPPIQHAKPEDFIKR